MKITTLIISCKLPLWYFCVAKTLSYYMTLIGIKLLHWRSNFIIELSYNIVKLSSIYLDMLIANLNYINESQL